MAKKEMTHALQEKYRLMLAMRLEREELERQGIMKFSGSAAQQRKEASRQLARRFPGVLKELDRFDAESLKSRLVVLEACHADADLPLWAEITFNFHELLRNALKIKSWIASQRAEARSQEDILAAFLSTQQELYDPEHWSSAYSIEHLLEKIATPPGGRLSHLVWEVLEERFELSAGEMRQLAFGMGDD